MISKLKNVGRAGLQVVMNEVSALQCETLKRLMTLERGSLVSYGSAFSSPLVSRFSLASYPDLNSRRIYVELSTEIQQGATVDRDFSGLAKRAGFEASASFFALGAFL